MHPDHLLNEVKALPVFGVPAIAMAASVVLFVVWFIAYLYVVVDWLMPVLVFAVCAAALVVMLPILLCKFNGARCAITKCIQPPFHNIHPPSMGP